MAIDPEKEKLVPLIAAHKEGIERCKTTLKNWAKTGKLSQVTGERVKLEVFYEGHMPCTSYEAYLRFLYRLNGLPIPLHLHGAPDPDEEDDMAAKKGKDKGKGGAPAPKGAAPKKPAPKAAAKKPPMKKGEAC
jgi:hypothetical protein